MRHSSQDKGGACLLQRRLFRGLTIRSLAIFNIEFQSPISLSSAMLTAIPAV
jgi:hypothetical protein